MIDPQADPSVDPVPDAAQAASDELVLLGARLRDEIALGVLYDRYAGLVFTLAQRVVGDWTLAEKIVQDVILRCWHGQEQYDGSRGTPAVWLLGITRRHALEARRQHQRDADPAESTQPAEAIDLEPAAATRPEELALRAQVGRAIAELSHPERAAVDLAYYDGLTRAEIADQLGEPLQTVEISIHDGLSRLHRALGAGVDPSAAGSDGAW
jgi:RNA polymerase sigma-70 factor (ECF subfamily)